jgi:hypothetical protein
MSRLRKDEKDLLAVLPWRVCPRCLEDMWSDVVDAPMQRVIDVLAKSEGWRGHRDHSGPMMERFYFWCNGCGVEAIAFFKDNAGTNQYLVGVYDVEAFF